jgi:HAD superfamily hydrolase (TIGR01509 family)
MKDFQIILFDLSGVLVELGGMPDFVKWTGRTPSDIGSAWLTSESTRNFERGITDFSTFHKAFVDEWNVDISNSELESYFRQWVKAAYPETKNLLEELKGRLPLACLTNTNSIQWPVVKETIEADYFFDHQFVSHLMGKVKPDAEVYEHVIDSLQVPPSSIVFLDDSILNVEQANLPA